MTVPQEIIIQRLSSEPNSKQPLVSTKGPFATNTNQIPHRKDKSKFADVAVRLWITSAKSWGVFLGIPGGGVLPVLQFLILVQTKNWHFSYLFSDLASKKFCHHYLDQKSNKQRFLKIHFIVAHFSFFLPHLELKRQRRLYTLVDPWKTIPISHQNDAEPYPLGQYIPTWLI